MSEGLQTVFARTDQAVRPVVLHVWPGATYDVPFFVAMQYCSNGASCAAVVSVVLAPSDEAGYAPFPNVAVAVNGHELPNVAWKAYAPYDITSLCVPGRNVLSLRNLQADESAAVLVAVDMRRAMNTAAFVARIPRDADDLDLESLCFGSSKTFGHGGEDIQALGVVASTTCPISRCPIQDCVRGRTCKHAQGFDASSFLSLCQISGSWRCPLCSATLYPEDLVRIDLPRKLT